MQRTIRLELTPSVAQAAQFVITRQQFTTAFNAVCAVGWEQQITNGVKLHHATYYPLRSTLPDLPSNLLVQARMKATEAIKSAFVLQKKGRKVGRPVAVDCPPRYNQRTYTLDWESQTVRMSLVGGRQTVRFNIPEYSTKYAGNPIDTADLLFRHGRWWLHVVVTVAAPEIAPIDQVVGVDLGVVRPAVTSHHLFLGERNLKRLRGKQARFRRNNDHILSKQIVGSTEPGATIVVENLTNIRKRVTGRHQTQTQRRIHGWSFAQLKSFIAYKAEERGCTVVAVDPRHTSQACSCCGHTARTNRRSRGRFVCRKCGFELHADLNAARNIAAKYHARSGRAAAGGLPVNQPIVSSPIHSG